MERKLQVELNLFSWKKPGDKVNEKPDENGKLDEKKKPVESGKPDEKGKLDDTVNFNVNGKPVRNEKKGQSGNLHEKKLVRNNKPAGKTRPDEDRRLMKDVRYEDSKKPEWKNVLACLEGSGDENGKLKRKREPADSGKPEWKLDNPGFLRFFLERESVDSGKPEWKEVLSFLRGWRRVTVAGRPALKAHYPGFSPDIARWLSAWNIPLPQ